MLPLLRLFVVVPVMLTCTACVVRGHGTRGVALAVEHIERSRTQQTQERPIEQPSYELTFSIRIDPSAAAAAAAAVADLTSSR